MPDPPPTQYFTGMAHAYTRHRPSYAPQAIDFILHELDPPIHAASIGCGTGICCRLLADRGVRIIGIDPNDDMLSEARPLSENASPAITYQPGTAEDTSLDDHSVDLVICAQAFHWFDDTAALDEFHRTLKPRRRLALMWNVRVPTDPVGIGYLDVTRRAQEDAEARGRVVHVNRSADPTTTGRFTNLRRAAFTNPQVLDQRGLLGRIRSASYFPTEDPLKSELEQQLLDLFADNAHDGYITLPQETQVTLAAAV